MLKKIIVILIPLSAIVFIVIAWLQIDFKSQNRKKGYDFFNEEVFFIGEISDIRLLTNAYKREGGSFFKSPSFATDFNDFFVEYPQIFMNQEDKKKAADLNIYFGLFEVKNHFDMLWVLKTKGKPENFLKDISKGESNEQIKDFSIGEINELTINNKKWFLQIDQNFIVFSANKELVTSAIEHSNKNTNNLKSINTHSKFAELNLFVNQKQLLKWYKRLYPNASFEEWYQLWSKNIFFDFHFKEQGLFLSLTSSDISDLEELLSQYTQRKYPKLLAWLPRDCRHYFWISLMPEGYYNLFNRKLKELLPDANQDKAFEYLKWVEGEVVFFNFKNKKLLAVSKEFSSFDIDLILEELNLKVSGLHKDSIDFIDYSDVRIRKFLGGQQLVDYFPSFLLDQSLNFYAIIEGNLVFASEVSILKDLIDMNTTDKRLYSEKEIENEIIANHNENLKVLFWHSMQFDERDTSDILSVWHQESFPNSDRTFYWSMAGIQDNQNSFLHHLSWMGTAFAIDTLNTDHQETEWVVDLDYQPTGKYITFYDPANGNIMLVEGDDAHLHLINSKGNEIKRVKFSSTLIGKPQFISSNKGKEKYLLFNTLESLYLTDLKGNIIKGFPYNSSVPISGTARVFDYENNGALRIIAPLSNGEVLNIDKTGKLVQGWEMLEVNEKFVSHPRHFIREGKDYLCFFTESQKLYAVDRRGNLRPGFPFDFSGWTGGEFKLSSAESIDQSYIRYISEDGVLKRVFFSGKKDETALANKERHYIWDLEDLTGDGNPEFIATRSKYITVYNDVGIEIFNFPAKVTNIHLMQIVRRNKDQSYLGYINSERNQLNMINPFGELVKGYPIDCTNLFLTIDVNGNNTRELVYFKNNQLICTSKW